MRQRTQKQAGELTHDAQLDSCVRSTALYAVGTAVVVAVIVAPREGDADVGLEDVAGPRSQYLVPLRNNPLVLPEPGDVRRRKIQVCATSERLRESSASVHNHLVPTVRPFDDLFCSRIAMD